jgi:hypothetical protein
MRVPAVALVFLVTYSAGPARIGRSDHGPELPAAGGLYDLAADHVWNRVHRQLHVRTAPDGTEYGDDELDPLLWAETRYLLKSPSHENAIRVLDEFLNEHAERLVRDPLKRAVFQHDLWAVFDWVVASSDDHPEERRALAARLARVMRRVALSKEEIDRLPDNYAAAVERRRFADDYDPEHTDRAFLPRDLFDATGPWLGITDSFTEPIAAQHASTFSHSEFSVLLNVPGGAAATLDYLKRLWDFSEPYTAEAFHDGEQRSALNPGLPQLPSGTKVALIRKMLLIDSAGHIARSHLTESVQLRVFHAPARVRDSQGFHGDQDFFEFRTLRRLLFAGDSGGLHAIEPGEPGFVIFSSQGADGFDGPMPTVPRAGVLQACVNCHREHGIRSVLIAPRLLKPHPRLDFRHPRWSVYAQPAPAAKARRHDWGLLQAWW